MLNSVSYAALAAALLASSTAASAADSGGEEIVVTASRTQQGVPRELLGSSVTIIQPQDLELRQTRIVSDVLRDVPGLAVSRLGAVGGFTQVRIRGAEANHTLVLIDGMKASDPFLGEFDFATLIADEVAKVEVLRGQQSALYGSDAIGGVINYITLSGKEAPGVSARAEGGSFGSYDAAVRAAGYAGGFDYALSAGFQHTDGVPVSRFGTRKVGAENTALSARVSYQITDNFRVRAVGRYSKTWAEADDQDFDFTSPTYGFVIDSDDYARNRAFYGLVGADLDLMGGAWTHSITLQGADAKREGFSGGLLDSGDKGGRFKATYVTAYHFGDDRIRHTLTGGVDYERESFQNRGPFLSADQTLKRRVEDTGFIGQYDLTIGESFGFGAALRYDKNDLFRSATTYRVQASYLFDFGTRLHGAAGSGIKNPGIFELYGFDPGSFIGNPGLKPERSEGWEAGIEQNFMGNTVRLDATYFDSRLKDEIFTDFSNFPISTVGNRDVESPQHGVEVSAQAIIAKAWRVFAGYTYLDAREKGEQEVRRAPNIASLNVGYVDPDGLFSAGVTVRYNGETFDNNFTLIGPPRVRLSSFTLVNLDGDLRLTDAIRLYGRIENLFDETYEEVYTYRTPGRGAYLGIKANF